jgi:chorismate mutase
MCLRTLLARSLCYAAGAAILFAAPAPAAAASADTALTNLIALAAQRLALAEPVALWKRLHHQSITDGPREQLLLTQIARQAKAAQVDPKFAEQFFKDQIEASKDVQNALLAQWREAPPTAAAPDLAGSTRPQLDRLTHTLLIALVRVQPQRDAPDCPSRLAQSLVNWKNLTSFDSSRAGALNRALSHVCAAGGVGAIG